MRAIIFGASGQDGHYLSGLLRERGLHVVGVSRTAGGVDVGSFDAVSALVKAHCPEYIFQLAARSTTRHDALFENHAAIATGALNVLESARLHAPGARVFLPGSGVQFRNGGQAISERDEFEASSPYSVARIHSVYAARYYRTLGVRAYVGYLFHHDSPLRGPGHVSRTIAAAAARIADGQGEALNIGDVSVEKEWTFAGDVVRGMWTLVQQDEVTEAAIGSGRAYAIRDWLELCFSHVGLRWEEHVVVSESFQAEYARLVSDPRTMNSLGWRPAVAIEALAAMMVDAEVARLSRQSRVDG